MKKLPIFVAISMFLYIATTQSSPPILVDPQTGK